MSENLLKALMQLFAIIANVEDLTNKSRRIVEEFLRQTLSADLAEDYLVLYDQYLEVHHKVSKKKEGKRKRTSVNSVKVLRICSEINTELAQPQKFIVLIRLIEYITADKDGIDEQSMEFVETVADSFNIAREEFDALFAFMTCSSDQLPFNPNLLVIDGDKEVTHPNDAKHIYNEGIEERAIILQIESVSVYLIRYFGEKELLLNGQGMLRGVANVFKQGSSIRSSRVTPIYYSDVIGRFLSDTSESSINFTVDKLHYKFAEGTTGLHDLTFSEDAGSLIGIMGASGSGKSTLLNLLNGNYNPTEGHVLVNGVSIHNEPEKVSGLIGYISQDDLLIEELTVFDNLYLNAKLCFDDLPDGEIIELVNKTLTSLGLYDRKHLKVGSPLEKFISGGQRKRLNIALELIREPSILFVDEPTSGLSSRDSENIMDLLKELALKGKVIFVVIHQPSSDIFKMFDKLLLLDVGGFPVYYGNPLDAILYFKTATRQALNNESECQTCGNVNPEQIFNIIESPVIDEYGSPTGTRKVSPKEWYELYVSKIQAFTKIEKSNWTIPKINFKIPSKLTQTFIFIKRDVMSKLANNQYLAINLGMAPVLALLLAFFMRYYDISGDTVPEYLFFENSNIPAFIFISVVVALFIGLSVSAEEIIKDRKIRKRESFLNLSWGSYLSSKITIMFALSAVQTFMYVMLGNTILGIDGMYWEYWLILFSASCFSNMLGLNISSAFNSAVTIYILIPFLIIPQLLFSGVIVKFDKLNPVATSQTEVPIIGEVMTSRWAFEALAVRQFKKNEYGEIFYAYDKQMSVAGFKKNFWTQTLKNKLKKVQNNPEQVEENQLAIQMLRNELIKEKEVDVSAAIAALENDPLKNSEVLEEVVFAIDAINSHYIKEYNAYSRAKDEIIREMRSTEEGKAKFEELKNNYRNESLGDAVKNAAEFKQVMEYENEIIQRIDPVYKDSDSFRSHFYAPRKSLFGQYMDTFWVNFWVMWSMSILLVITLYFEMFRGVIDWFGNLGNLFAGKKR